MLIAKMHDGAKNLLKDEMRMIWRGCLRDHSPVPDGITKLRSYRYLVSELAVLFMAGNPDLLSEQEFKDKMNCRIFDAGYSGPSGERSFLLVFDTESDCMMFELTHRANWNSADKIGFLDSVGSI